jgi:hypothetical protein
LGSTAIDGVLSLLVFDGLPEMSTTGDVTVAGRVASNVRASNDSSLRARSTSARFAQCRFSRRDRVGLSSVWTSNGCELMINSPLYASAAHDQGENVCESRRRSKVNQKANPGNRQSMQPTLPLVKSGKTG